MVIKKKIEKTLTYRMIHSDFLGKVTSKMLILFTLQLLLTFDRVEMVSVASLLVIRCVRLFDH